MTLDQLVKVHEEFIGEMRACDGKLWKEAHSELHDPYKEIPVWILLFDDSALDEVHRRFKTIVSKFIGRIDGHHFTVSFAVYTDEGLMELDFLTNNEEILRGWSVKPPLGNSPSPMRNRDLFRSQDSKRSLLT